VESASNIMNYSIICYYDGFTVLLRGKLTFLKKLFIYSHVHTLFVSFLPPASLPSPLSPFCPQFQAGPVLPLTIIFFCFFFQQCLNFISLTSVLVLSLMLDFKPSGVYKYSIQTSIIQRKGPRGSRSSPRLLLGNKVTKISW
jgi:hypothetical protein